MSFDISSLTFAYNAVSFKKRIHRAAGRSRDVVWMLSLALGWLLPFLIFGRQ